MHTFRRIVSGKKMVFLRLGAVALTLLLTTGLLSQAAFAQTTYVITDGDRVLVHTTYETDPAEVLSEAGLELGAEDTFTAQTDGGVSAITVNRIQLVRVQNGGEELEVATYGSTVSGILEQLGISTEGELRISQDLDAQTYDGMVIDVVYLRTETRQYIRTEPYDTVYCTDSTLEPGAEKILTPGRNGSILCTAEIIYENGVEISRSVLREKVLYTPVNALVARGIDRSSKEQEGAGRAYVQEDAAPETEPVPTTEAAAEPEEAEQSAPEPQEPEERDEPEASRQYLHHGFPAR